MWWGWVVVAVVAIVYTAASKRLATTAITLPMVFVALGAVVAQGGLDIVTVELDGDLTKALFKTTLALLLFVEAAGIDPGKVRSEASITARLLGLAMPLLIAAGFAVALAAFDVLSLWEAAIVGTILAPTDAALGAAVVSNPRVPREVRRSLVVESGLNDGLALPLALAFAAGALADFGVKTDRDAVVFMLEQAGFGAIAGVVLGLAAAWLLAAAVRRGWADADWVRLSPLAVALLAYAGAEAIDGNGFIAAWVAGLCYGYLMHRVDTHVEHFGHSLGTVLTAISFFVFGAAMLGPELSEMTWQMVLYGLVSLALLRPAAVALGMIGSKLRWPTVLFMGWFGPRGIASIIIAAIVIKELGLPHDDVIVLITTATVTMSVFLHGLTAVPLAGRYADWAESNESVTAEA